MRTSFLDFEQAIAGFDGKIETLRFKHDDPGTMESNLRKILQEGPGLVNVWSIDQLLENHFARLMAYGCSKERPVC